MEGGVAQLKQTQAFSKLGESEQPRHLARPGCPQPRGRGALHRAGIPRSLGLGLSCPPLLGFMTCRRQWR